MSSITEFVENEQVEDFKPLNRVEPLNMQCFVYRSRKQPDMYVYLPQKDDFSAIPDALNTKLGALEFALEFDLHPEKKLAKEDAQEVINNINGQGFHLQMPDQLETVTALDTRLN